MQCVEQTGRRPAPWHGGQERSSTVGVRVAGLPSLEIDGLDANGALARAVDALQHGHNREASFRTIFRIFGGELFGFFRYRGLAREEAEDLVQETFLNVVNDIAGYRREAPFRHWLFALASNCMRRYFRYRDAGKRSGEEVTLDAIDHLTGVGWCHESIPSPLDDTMRTERSVRLRRAARQLPEAMRRCVLLRLEGDYGAPEIGRALAINPATVRVRLHRARRLLRHALGDDERLTSGSRSLGS